MITGLGIYAFNPRGFGVEGVVVNSTGVLGPVEEQAAVLGENVVATGEIGARSTGLR